MRIECQEMNLQQSFEKFKNINKIKEVCRNILIFVANNIRLVDDNILAINLTCGIAFGQDDVLLKAQLALKVARKNNLLLTIFKESHRVVTRKKYNDIKNLAKYKEALLFWRFISLLSTNRM